MWNLIKKKKNSFSFVSFSMLIADCCWSSRTRQSCEFFCLRIMVGKNSYVPPPYIPIGQSDVEADLEPPTDATPALQIIQSGTGQWSSGICACFDDMQSCMLLSALWSWFIRSKKSEWKVLNCIVLELIWQASPVFTPFCWKICLKL